MTGKEVRRVYQEVALSGVTTQWSTISEIAKRCGQSAGRVALEMPILHLRGTIEMKIYVNKRYERRPLYRRTDAEVSQ